MKRDVYRYFVGLQQQLNEANKDKDKINKDIENGLLTEEQCVQFQNYYNTLLSNYTRVAYIIHLLQQPLPFIQKLRIKRDLALARRLIEDAKVKDEVDKENKTALDNMHATVKEVDNARDARDSK